MPTVYLRKDLYDAIIKASGDVNQYVNTMVENALKPQEVPLLVVHEVVKEKKKEK